MGISAALGSSALLPAGLGFRNLIINGDMRLAQRGTSTSSITTANYYTTDRWYLNVSSGGTWTMAQTTDAPTSEGFGYSTKLTCTTAQASPATTNNARFWQKIEGFNVAGLAKGTNSPKPVVLSFWVKSGLTGTFICTLDDLDNSRKISASYTINAANTWEKKTLSFNGDTTGAFTIDNSEALMVTWWLMAGPSFQGSSLSTSWSSSSTLTDYANGQTNVAAGNNSSVNYWQVTGVQLEQNYQPTPFEQRPIGVELALCQRYYYRWQARTNDDYVCTGAVYSSGDVRAGLMFPTTVRTTSPVVTFRGGNEVEIVVAGIVNRSATITPTSANSQTCELIIAPTTTLTAGHGCIIRSYDTACWWEVNAEL